MTDLQTILALLPKLSKADRATLVARANALGSSQGPADTVTMWMYSSVIAICGWDGARLPPLSVARKSKNWKNLEAAFEVITKFIDVEIGALNINDRRRVVLILVRCAVEGLNFRKMPLAIWSLAWALSNINMMVEDAFPGYRAAGLLREAFLEKENK